MSSSPAPNPGRAVAAWVLWEANLDMEFSGRAFMKDWQAPGLGRGRDRAGVSQRARPAPTQAQGTPQRLVLQRVLNRAGLARPPPPTLVGVTLTRGSVCEQPLCGLTPEGRQPSLGQQQVLPRRGSGQCPPVSTRQALTKATIRGCR